jgi:hypothetical protein
MKVRIYNRNMHLSTGSIILAAAQRRHVRLRVQHDVRSLYNRRDGSTVQFAYMMPTDTEAQADT